MRGLIALTLAAAATSGCAVVIVDSEPAPASRPVVPRPVHARPVRAAVSKRVVLAKATSLQARTRALAVRVERRRVRGRVRMSAKEIAAVRREAEELKQEAGILADMRNDAALSGVELQNAMQAEARAMQTISNALRAAHDASQNTIRNVR